MPPQIYEMPKAYASKKPNTNSTKEKNALMLSQKKREKSQCVFLVFNRSNRSEF